MVERKIDREKIKTWFVVGASSGVGLEFVKQLLARSYNVVAVSRQLLDFDHENLLSVSADVTKIDEIEQALHTAINRFGHVDVLVNNAGISANVFFEEESLEHMQDVMNTNFWGTVNTMKIFVPYFRGRGYGTIVNNTSQSGISCRAKGAAYVASKHALEGITGVCWHECRAFCRVMAFELGYFKNTGIYKTSVNQKCTIPEYKKVPMFYRNFSRNFVNNLTIAVKYVIDQVECKELPRRLMLGRDALIQIGTELDWLKKDYSRSYLRAISCSGDRVGFFDKIKAILARYFFTL